MKVWFMILVSWTCLMECIRSRIDLDDLGMWMQALLYVQCALNVVDPMDVLQPEWAILSVSDCIAMCWALVACMFTRIHARSATSIFVNCIITFMVAQVDTSRTFTEKCIMATYCTALVWVVWMTRQVLVFRIM